MSSVDWSGTRPPPLPERWEEKWVGASGTKTVAEMDDSHLRNTLALILREARRGMLWRMNDAGRLQFYKVAKKADLIVADIPSQRFARDLFSAAYRPSWLKIPQKPRDRRRLLKRVK